MSLYTYESPERASAEIASGKYRGAFNSFLTLYCPPYETNFVPRRPETCYQVPVLTEELNEIIWPKSSRCFLPRASYPDPFDP